MRAPCSGSFHLPSATFYHLSDSAPLAAAADEAEDNVGNVREVARGVQQGGEWMTGAVIAGIHDYKFAVQAVRFAEAVPAIGIEPNFAVVRPRWQDGDFFGRDSFRGDPVAHEPVKSNNTSGLLEAIAGHQIQQLRGH